MTDLESAILGGLKFKNLKPDERVSLCDEVDEAAYFLATKDDGFDFSMNQEPSPTAPQLPSELDNDRARVCFAKAVEFKLLSEQFEWLASKALLACFCREMSVKLDLGKGYNGDGQKRLCWRPFEQLFNVKKGSLRASLNDIQKTGQDPIGIKKINAIFKE